MNKVNIPTYLEEEIKEARSTDIVVGILCKNVEATILYVMNAVSEGLHKHFSEYKKMIIVSDGFSSDRTVEIANLFQPYNSIKKIVTRDIVAGGKGAGVRTILEVAKRVNAKVVVLLDGDLLSIKPEWIYEFSSPILYGRADLVVPYYIRDKYDGIITNNLVYPFTRALYGIDIRQPIAGEYGISKNLYEMLLNYPSFPYDFGIDVFIVTSAAAHRMLAMEGLFSLKIHESITHYFNPEDLIAPMFRQVTNTMFNLAKHYESFWRNNVKRSYRMESRRFYGQKPIPVRVDINKIREYFEKEYASYKTFINRILSDDLLNKIAGITKNVEKLDAETWAEVVYNFAAYYKKFENEKYMTIDALKSIWLGRFLSYAIETKDMEWNEAEEVIQKQARIFEEKLNYFLNIY